MNLLEKKEVKEYREFRKLIFSGPLYILKHEYIHILYKLYIRIIRSIFKLFMVKKDNSSNIQKIKTKEVLFNFKSDYKFSLKYMKEIHYLETVYEGNFNYESLKRDGKIMRIMNPNYRIIISKYAFDVLLTYIERLDFSFLQDTILTREKNKLLVSQNLLTESYINQCYIEDEKNITNIDLINSCNYIIGMLRDNYNFLIKLEEIIYRKSHPDEKAIEVELENKFPIEKSSATFLSNCPDYKNKYLVDLAKNYINRRVITKKKLASVLELKFDDPEGKITVVEFSRTLKLVLIGTINGIIKSYLFFKDGKEQESSENPENLKMGKTPYNLLKENIKNQKFNIETESIKYIGHKGAITTISLAFDSSYFISGGADGDIRLWNTLSGTCLAVFKAHIKTIWNVKLAYRGYYFASSCDDGIILLWATNKYTPLKNFIGHTGEISCLEFSKNMIYLISASYDLSVRVWNIDDQEIVRIFFFDNVVMRFFNKFGN